MKILATADIHGSQYRLNIVLKNIEKYSPDLVVVCGDITQFGPGELAKVLLDQIPLDTLAITGNIDTTDVNQGIENSKATNVGMKRIIKSKIPFVGIDKLGPDQLKFIEKNNLIDNKSIVISHEPPYGAQDKVFFGMHGGNKELRNIVDKYHPRLVLCGHIHEDPGFTKIGVTTVVNCSMGKRGEGAFIKINDNVSVKMIV
jgi:Icc-related predicted phosphoesterase